MLDKKPPKKTTREMNYDAQLMIAYLSLGCIVLLIIIVLILVLRFLVILVGGML